MQNVPIPDALIDAIYRAALQVYRRHRDVMMGFASGDPHDRNTVPLSDLEDFKRDIEDELTVVLSEIVNQNVQYHDAAAVASAAHGAQFGHEIDGRTIAARGNPLVDRSAGCW